MTTSYSTNLALALPVQGELSGTWGTTVNTGITNMVDEALGYQAYSATGGADTLTIPDGVTGVARSIFIQLNGTGGGSVAVPTAKTKMYFVFNNTSSAITFKVTGQTGVSIPAAGKMALVSNGTDIIIAQNYFAALTLGAALPVASGGTGLTAGTSGGVLAYTATGTLASSGALTQYGVVYGGGAGVTPSATANGTTGQAFIATTSGAPSWGTLGPAGGGTGVANNAAMTVTGSGNFAYTRTLTAATNVTFPTTGTLSTLAGTETFTNKTLTNPTVTNYVESVVAIGNSGTTQTLSLTSGTVQTVTMTGNCTFTMPTATAGKSFILICTQDATGSRTATFTSVKFPAGTAPTLTTTATTGVDILTFVANGTSWFGTFAQAFA